MGILAATRDGLHGFDDQGNPQPVEHTGHSVTAVMRDGPQLWAILDGAAIWHAPESDRQASL